MLITEVEITESSVTTQYAALLPSGQVLAQWLSMLVEKVVQAPASENRILLETSSGNVTITRRNVTDVSITLATE